MRWMVYRWWCEGGGDRAWWFIESVFLRSPEKGFWACLWDLPPEMLRRLETWVSLCNLMLKLLAFRTAPLSSGRIVPRVTITSFKHSIAGYLRIWPVVYQYIFEICWAITEGTGTSFQWSRSAACFTGQNFGWHQSLLCCSTSTLEWTSFRKHK